MNVFKRIKWTYVLLSVFFLVLGLLLVCNPGTSMVTICCILGGIALAFGVVKIVLYFVRDIEGVAVRYDFAVGAFTVIVGALLLWRAPTMVGILSVVIGLFILVDCVFKLQVAIDSRRMGASSWWVTLLFTCVCMVMGFLLVFDPFSGQQVLATVMGISLIADGLQNLCTVIYAAVFVKDVKDAVRDMVDEATAVETTGEVVEDGDTKQ
ncbi:MAG: DUF308 domain-containing protein [Clostridiales bacterium]|nr:DUF308 domain-containing protein [Clostridiales bacterium]MDD6936881.1 DUF308 domain-containing protein [Clostridiales bacterium]MDY2961496.1 DUF308 domain-containing protein [Oscillospiraceae bacterium]